MIFLFDIFRLDFRSSQSPGFGSFTIIGKDTIIQNEVSPGVVMDGLAAAHKYFSPSKSASSFNVKPSETFPSSTIFVKPSEFVAPSTIVRPSHAAASTIVRPSHAAASLAAGQSCETNFVSNVGKEGDSDHHTLSTERERVAQSTESVSGL